MTRWLASVAAVFATACHEPVDAGDCARIVAANAVDIGSCPSSAGNCRLVSCWNVVDARRAEIYCQSPIDAALPDSGGYVTEATIERIREACERDFYAEASCEGLTPDDTGRVYPELIIQCGEWSQSARAAHVPRP